ncbi:MAG: tRNA (guanosine(37)-N1)-methyltransferase TrmD [Pseudomonadota bacterium]
MKQVAIVTLFPEMFDALTQYGVTARAIKQGLLSLYFSNPREFTTDRHQTVDDRPYGGGPGMVMKIEPLKAAIDAAKARLVGPAKVIYLSPQGQVFKQDTAKRFALADSYERVVLVAGRYEGIDERLLTTEVDEEWSIGDYVLSGGELPAMVLLDAMIRRLPGALGHKHSAEQDSFSEALLDCPHYTRPEVYKGQRVPKVLLSGDHQAIAEWRQQQALARTLQRRNQWA